MKRVVEERIKEELAGGGKARGGVTLSVSSH